MITEQYAYYVLPYDIHYSSFNISYFINMLYQTCPMPSQYIKKTIYLACTKSRFDTSHLFKLNLFKHQNVDDVHFDFSPHSTFEASNCVHYYNHIKFRWLFIL